MTFLILGFIFLIYGVILFYKANQIKINKDKQQEQYKEQLKKELNILEININNLIHSETEKKKELNKELIQFQESRKKEIETGLECQEQLAKLTIN